MITLEMQPSAPEGVSPVQWWILTEYTHGMEKYKLEVGDVRAAGLSKPTDPQTSSSTPEKTGDIVGEGQDVSANMSEVSISELQSEKTSSMESNEVAAQPGKLIALDNAGICSGLSMTSVSCEVTDWFKFETLTLFACFCFLARDATEFNVSDCGYG